LKHPIDLYIYDLKLWNGIYIYLIDQMPSYKMREVCQEWENESWESCVHTYLLGTFCVMERLAMLTFVGIVVDLRWDYYWLLWKSWVDFGRSRHQYRALLERSKFFKVYQNLVTTSPFFVFFTWSFLPCKDKFMDDYEGI
jgi:hypothetical protein